jgi:hypothetical protein
MAPIIAPFPLLKKIPKHLGRAIPVQRTEKRQADSFRSRITPGYEQYTIGRIIFSDPLPFLLKNNKIQVKRTTIRKGKQQAGDFRV